MKRLHWVLLTSITLVHTNPLVISGSRRNRNVFTIDVNQKFFSDKKIAHNGQVLVKTNSFLAGPNVGFVDFVMNQKKIFLSKILKKTNPKVGISEKSAPKMHQLPNMHRYYFAPD